MTILSIPVPTHSVKGWRNIASTFPFCVQQNSNLDTPSHNEAGTDINGYTWESEDEDVPPTTTAAVDKQSFRIMHTQCPSDLSSRDSLLSLDSNRGTGSGDGAKAHRVVVAVSSSLGDILEDWGWILQQWKSSGNSDNAALSAVAWDRTLALIKRAQEDEDTAPPFSGGDTCVFQPATDSGNGDNNSNNTGRVGGNDAPLPAQRINVNNNNAKITTTGGKRNGGENVTTDNNGNNNNSDKHSGGTTTINEEAQFYDFYDTALLRLYDLWLWETPQLTALMLLSLWSRPILHGWSAVLAIGLFVAMPIGPRQQQRRKQWSDKSQATCVADARKKCESDKQKLATLHSFTKQVSIQTVKIAAAVAVIAAGLSCTFAHQSFDMFVLGLTTLLVLGSGVQQLILMRTSQKQQQSVTPAVTPSSRVTCPLVVEDLCSSQPQQASTTRGEAPSDVPPLSSAFRHLRRTESTGAMVESATRSGGPPPLYESGTPSASSTTRHNQFRYTLPALTDKETTIEAQLSNYGAPFSIILLKPLREWNQMNASWVTRWERGGLRYEEHYGSSSSINIRMTARIPHANVGTLQSILLDDIDCLDAKSTWAYQYNPLLTQRCLVKRLGYNTMITLTRYRSMVCGVPPLELLHYVSPAILLDEEQQEALQLRRPFSAAQTPTTNSPSDNNNNNSKTRKPLMAFVQCGIPCPAELHSTPPCQPPHERGATEYFFTIGMEEADGSLTVGVYQSLRPEGIVPEEWALVYKAATARKAFKLTELLRQEGPKENRVAVYRNERAFQPIVDRQAVSEGEPKQMNLAAMSASRRAAALSRDEANLGSAFLTSELKVADTTPRRLRRQLEGSSTALPCSPGAHCRTLSLSHDINALTSTFPRLVEKFMKELLACSAWKSDGENDGVRYHSATTALSSRKATRTDVFIPKASIAMMCNLLMIDSLAAEYDRSIKDRVTITPSILQKLLVDSVSNNNNNNNNSKGTTIDFARESYHGCALRYTQYRSSMWGSASRDTVTRVAEPYYMTVSDVTAFLTSCNVADNFNMFNTVSPTSRLFVLCGEDAGDALPSFKGYQRQRVPLFGTMCWEEGDGIRVVFCECTAPAGGGILSAATASARSVQDQVKMTRNVKGLVEHYLQDVQTD